MAWMMQINSSIVGSLAGVALVCLVGSSARGQSNLLVNGNFSLGNTGFTSQYTYLPGSSAAGAYDVGSNPQADNAGWVSTGDHTTGTGLMLIVNGGANLAQIVWSETINVATNRSYALSGWAADIFAGTDPAPPNLAFTINGVQVGNPVQIQPASFGWQSFTTLWNSQSSTQAVIAVVDLTTIAYGNDFALDDLVFAPLSTNSTTAATIYRSVEINWDSISNATYQVQWTPALPASNWFNLGNPVTAIGTNTSVWDRVGWGQRFYQVLNFQ